MWKAFLLGCVVGPIALLLLARLAYVIWRQHQSIRDWYLGLPIIQWPAMWLVVLGLKFLRQSHCRTMTYEGRFWFSPQVEMFRDKH